MTGYWRGMIPTEWILVTGLYILLFHEIVTHVMKTSTQALRSSGTRGPSTNANRLKSQPVNEQKKYNNTLDGLWKRMNQATESFKLSGVRHDLVTRTMAQARTEARRMEAQKIAAARAVDMGSD